MDTQEHGFNYKDWYQKNKERLSEKKAKRYQEDANYREAAKKRSKNQRQNKPQPADPEGFTISFSDMAATLGVTQWVLREWRRKNYFPEPRQRGNRLWFKPDQVSLLMALQVFFSMNNRVSKSNKAALESLVELTYANW